MARSNVVDLLLVRVELLQYAITMLKQQLLGRNDSSQETTRSFSSSGMFRASISVDRLYQSTCRLLYPKDSDIVVIVHKTEEQPIW